MNLVNLQCELSHTNTLLERIAVALERLAGPAMTYTPPRPATLADYNVVSPHDIERAKEAEVEFASLNGLVPGSEAYVQAVEAYEKQLFDAYGQTTVDRLPWKQKPYAES